MTRAALFFKVARFCGCLIFMVVIIVVVVVVVVVDVAFLFVVGISCLCDFSYYTWIVLTPFHVNDLFFIRILINRKFCECVPACDLKRRTRFAWVDILRRHAQICMNSTLASRIRNLIGSHYAFIRIYLIIYCCGSLRVMLSNMNII